MKNYVSLIIDIEKSRGYSIKNRIEIQNYVSFYIEMLNELFCESIECDVTFSAGDELQGLFNDMTIAVMYFRWLELLTKPVKLRAGIGVGEWTIKIDNASSTHQDGPAYHRARKAIEEIYTNGLWSVKILSDRDDVMANHLLNASKVLKDQQIYMQNMVLVIMELLCPFAKKDMGVDEYQIIKKLLEVKSEYSVGMARDYQLRIETAIRNELVNARIFSFFKPIFVDGNMTEAKKHIMIKGVSTIISDILGCSRQNVDTILKRGNAYKIRELDYMALQYIESRYRE